MVGSEYARLGQCPGMTPERELQDWVVDSGAVSLPKLDPAFDDVRGVARLRLWLSMHFDIPPQPRGTVTYGSNTRRRKRLAAPRRRKR